MMLSLRIATRFLRKSPAQSVLIVAGITVGIGVQVFVGTLITSLQASLLDAVVGSQLTVTSSARERRTGPVHRGHGPHDAVDAGGHHHRADAQPLLSVRAGQRQRAAEPEGRGPRETGHDLQARGRASSRGALASLSADILVGTAFAEEYSVSARRPDRADPAGRLEVPPDRRRRSSTWAKKRPTSEALSSSSAFGQKALGQREDEFTAIETQVSEPFDSTDVADGWRSSAAFAGTDVKDWQEESADLLSALQSQSLSSNIIQVFVLIAIALGIASTLAISAVQKTRQIGILKAMGLSDRKTGQIFLWQAAILGSVGTALAWPWAWG